MYHRMNRCRSSITRRRSRIIILAVLHLATMTIAGCSTSRGRGEQRRPPAGPLHQDTDFIQVTVRGSLPTPTFEFRDCSGDYDVIMRAIDFGRDGAPTCMLESDNWAIPTIWKFGTEGPGYEVLRCEALRPGEYGIMVWGGWRGRAVLVIDDDGTARIENDLCEQHRSKQDPHR